MQKFPEVISLLTKQSWPRYLAVKTFEPKVGHLFAFIASSSGVLALQRTYQEFIQDLDQISGAGLFARERLVIVEGVPAKISDHDQKFIESIGEETTLIFIAAHDFKQEIFAQWLKTSFYNVEAQCWLALQNLLFAKQEQRKSYPSTALTIDKTIDLLLYQQFNLDSNLLPDQTLGSQHWTLFEQLLHYRSADSLSYKQLFQVLNQLETVYTWLISPQDKKRNFYIPHTIKKVLQQHSQQHLTKLRHFYLLYLKALMSFEYSQARFYLSAWAKNIV